ncbi:MAG: hypothetical protein GF355_04960 [Candidatus Eisenbacteria bacterium]|nr:hypothetical protein [Candidatus Eisenbacteria bacterium]
MQARCRLQRILKSWLLVLLIPLSLSCGDESSNQIVNPIQEPPIEVETRSGTLELPQGSHLDFDDLEALSFAGSGPLTQDGAFSLDATQPEKHQVICFTFKQSRMPAFLGLYDPHSGETVVNDSTTALALTLLNPHLIGTSPSQLTDYLNAVVNTSSFPVLLSQLRQAMRQDPEHALDYETNPGVYETAMRAARQGMESLGLIAPASHTKTSPPHVTDAAGPAIVFVNPRHIYYAAGVYPNEAQLTDVVTVNRKKQMVELQWGWPPIYFSGEEETEYSLGDGYFKFHIHKGGRFSSLGQLDDPVGRATTCNTAQIILTILDLTIGHIPTPDLVALSNHVHISVDQALVLESDMHEADTAGLFAHMLELIDENKTEIASWIWNDTESEAAQRYIHTISGLFKKAVFVLMVLDFVNDGGPFVKDLVFAPEQVNYYITQEDGTIVSTDRNYPPEPQLSVSPPYGTVATSFLFDASATVDDHDESGQLLFRWDWEADGVWDSEWSNDNSVAHQFSSAGEKIVVLEVQDTGRLTTSIRRSVLVTGEGDDDNLGLRGYCNGQDNVIQRPISATGEPLDIAFWARKSSNRDGALHVLLYSRGEYVNRYNMLPNGEIRGDGIGTWWYAETDYQSDAWYLIRVRYRPSGHYDAYCYNETGEELARVINKRTWGSGQLDRIDIMVRGGTTAAFGDVDSLAVRVAATGSPLLMEHFNADALSAWQGDVDRYAVIPEASRW